MKRFHVFWFFFCVLWGALFSAPFQGMGPRPLLEGLAAFPGGVLTGFMIAAWQIWQMPADRKAPPPSFSLKPWGNPLGWVFFIVISFAYVGIWALMIAAFRSDGDIGNALYVFGLGGGGVVGVLAAYFAFRSRFVA